MKAAVLYEFGKDMAIEDVRLADPKDREVLLRITAAGVCHSDLSTFQGKGGVQLPTILGHEAHGFEARLLRRWLVSAVVVGLGRVGQGRVALGVGADPVDLAARAAQRSRAGRVSRAEPRRRADRAGPEPVDGPAAGSRRPTERTRHGSGPRDHRVEAG